jgi:hypothetical protein
VTIHWCNSIDVRFVLAIRRRFRRELLTGDEAQRIAAIRQTAAAFARAAYIEDYIGVSASPNAPTSAPGEVSSRSNIAEASVTPCPSMFLLDAFPFGFFNFKAAPFFSYRHGTELFAAHAQTPNKENQAVKVMQLPGGREGPSSRRWLATRGLNRRAAKRDQAL